MSDYWQGVGSGVMVMFLIQWGWIFVAKIIEWYTER